jgi:farnesyl-diphosphate farnesyltransferase
VVAAIDMEAFVGRESEKVEHLNNFYRTALVTEGWHMEGVGQGDEKTLLEQYFRCVSVFKGLSPESQEVIADITKRMGQVGTTL